MRHVCQGRQEWEMGETGELSEKWETWDTCETRDAWETCVIYEVIKCKAKAHNSITPRATHFSRMGDKIDRRGKEDRGVKRDMEDRGVRETRDT